MTDNRRCEHCGAAMPARTHRQTHPVTGKRVCRSCMTQPHPVGGTMTYSTQNLPAIDREWRRGRGGSLISRVNGWDLSVWEVASRKGKYQWSGHNADYMPLGGGEDWYDDIEWAKTDAVRAAMSRTASQHLAVTAPDVLLVLDSRGETDQVFGPFADSTVALAWGKKAFPGKVVESRELIPSFTLHAAPDYLDDAATWHGWNEASLRTLAHDSGDGADINHCPFCGSGSVIGGHSGTVECEFCHRFFTVQVQPEFRGMPQSVNGQPYNVPGMPGAGPDAGAAQEQGADEMGAAQEGAPPEKPPATTQAPPPPPNVTPKKPNPFGAPGAAPGGPPPPGGPPKAKKPNPFAASALLVTREGVALPAKAYLQHLALSHAEDRDAVLAQVRAENSG